MSYPSNVNAQSSVTPKIELCKFISPYITSGTKDLKGKEFIGQVFANLMEMFYVNLHRLAHAYHHTFSWVDNQALYVQVLEDSLDHMRFTAKNIEDLKNRFFSCGEEMKAEKLVAIYHKKMEDECKNRPTVGLKCSWGDDISSRMIEIGVQLNSLTNWALKMHYGAKWNDHRGMHGLDLVGGISVY